MSANVNERVRYELYYPPFQAAIDAGVLSVMCTEPFAKVPISIFQIHLYIIHAVGASVKHTVGGSG